MALIERTDGQDMLALYDLAAEDCRLARVSRLTGHLLRCTDRGFPCPAHQVAYYGCSRPLLVPMRELHCDLGIHFRRVFPLLWDASCT